MLQGDQATSHRGFRCRLMATGARAGTLNADLDALATFHARLAQEIHAWLEADHVAVGQASFFDTCDLRPWLALGARAKIPAVLTRTIFSLSPEET